MTNKYLEVGYSAHDFYVKALNLLAEHKDVPDDIFKIATFSKPITKYAIYVKVEARCVGTAEFKVERSEEVPTGNFTVKQLSNGKTEHVAEKKTVYSHRSGSKNYNTLVTKFVSLDDLDEAASVSEITEAFSDIETKKERVAARKKLDTVNSSVVNGSFLTELENSLDSRDVSSDVAKSLGARLSIDSNTDKITFLISSESKIMVERSIDKASNESIKSCRLNGNIEILSVTYYAVLCHTMEYIYKDEKYYITQKEDSIKVSLEKVPKPTGWSRNNPKTQAFLHISVLAPLIVGAALFLIYILLAALEIGGNIALYALGVPAIVLFVASGVFFAKRLKPARAGVADTKKQDLKKLLEYLNDGNF